MANIRWGYAINQWRVNETDLVTKEQRESALKVLSVSGFRAVEIGDNAIGGPEIVTAYFGSTFSVAITAKGLFISNSPVQYGLYKSNPRGRKTACSDKCPQNLLRAWQAFRNCPFGYTPDGHWSLTPFTSN